MLRTSMMRGVMIRDGSLPVLLALVSVYLAYFFDQPGLWIPRVEVRTCELADASKKLLILLRHPECLDERSGPRLTGFVRV